MSAFIIPICKWPNVKERDYMCLLRIVVVHEMKEEQYALWAIETRDERERRFRITKTGKLSNKVFNGIRYRKSKWSLHCEIIAYFHLHMSKPYELKEVKSFDFMRCKQLKMLLDFRTSLVRDRNTHTHISKIVKGQASDFLPLSWWTNYTNEKMCPNKFKLHFDGNLLHASQK